MLTLQKKIVMKVGILRETKNPPDRRVPITPRIGKKIIEKFKNVELIAQSSDLRSFCNEEYEVFNIPVKEHLEECDILVGVKEVKMSTFIPEKTYMFFSHTGKKQSYNRALLQEMSRLKITLIDYEYLVDLSNYRLVAFGRWAGIVGAYNAIYAYGLRTKIYEIRRAYECFDLVEMLSELDHLNLPPVKILITGGGRVAHGAIETLSHTKIKSVTPEEFLTENYNEPVFCRLDPEYYVKHKEDKPFDLKHFFKNPSEYESTFLPYALNADIFIPCHFWDPASPAFLKADDYLLPGFRIKVVADVSCDLVYPIASTLRSSTIADPLYGYNPYTQREDDPFDEHNITVMAIDNLPGELPRDASDEFSETLYQKVFPYLFGDDNNGIIEKATILKNGQLTPHFSYLQDYLDGK